MAGEGKRKLSEALEETLDRFEGAVEQVPALLGAYVDGQKFIVVTDQPDYVWCRIGGNESRRVKAFNSHAGGVAQHWDLPIIIVKDKLNPNVWKVIGRDITRYPDWGQTANYPYSSPYIAHHGADHSFSSQRGMGADPVWVFKRQMMPLLPHPAVSGSMGIEIGSDFYYFGGAYRWFASTGTVDFTAALPTGAMNGRFMTVYIDGTTGNPGYITGTEFNAVIPPIDPGDYIEIPRTDQGIAVAAVFLLTGTARIGWGEIYDLRWPHRPAPATGSVSFIYDDGQPQGSSNSLNFTRGINAAISGAFADVSLDQAFSPTWTGNHTFAGTGTFQVPTMFEALVGMAGDLHVTGTVYSGAGSFVTEQGFYRGQFLETIDQVSPPAAPASGRGRWYSQGGLPRFQAPGGTIYDLSATGSAGNGGGAGADRNVIVYDDGQFIVTGTVNFGDNLDVTVSGSRALITAPAATSSTGTTTIWSASASSPTGTANDDEFDDRSFDSGLWTEFDPDAIQTIDEQPYGLRLAQPTTAGDDVTGIYQSIPSGDFTISAKASFSGIRTDFSHAGLALWDDAGNSAAGIYTAGLSYDNNGFDWRVDRWNNYQSYDSGPAIADGSNAPQAFIRIRRNGTTYDFEFSSDGIGWMRISSISLSFTPDHFGFFVNNVNTGVTIAGIFQFFRYLDYDVGLTNPVAGRRVLVG